jgi:branched-chain amino acid transport system substrate-binding protein
MKKLIALLLAAMLLVPAFAMGENVIKIGVFEPSTGDNGAG